MLEKTIWNPAYVSKISPVFNWVNLYVVNSKNCPLLQVEFKFKNK